jgi:hypothetical protein
MKLIKNNWRKLLFIGLLFLHLFSCESNKKTNGNLYNPNEPVIASDFYPLEGGLATKLILNGQNFGNDLSQIRVYFNNKKAAVVNSNG